MSGGGLVRPVRKAVRRSRGGKPARVTRSAAAQRPQAEPGIGVLVASHSHPQFTRGGAEIAAYELFRDLRRRSGFDAWFMGCASDETGRRLGATFSQPFCEREYVYAAGVFDWFKFSNPDPAFPAEFRALLQQLQPRVVHFHHYLGFGLEAFLHVRETLPDCRIVLTLHEYLALCHHYGQMVTRPEQRLCHEASSARCNRCYGDIAPSDFFLRKLYIDRFFELVDHFIAPSEFLADRYSTWGVPRSRISVVENAIAEPVRAVAAAVRERERDDPLRVGFFGQISSLKGINVLLDTAEILEERREYNIVFDIHGHYAGQPPEFLATFLARLPKLGRNVRYHGGYDHGQVDQLMQRVDLVLMPSIWWENSPVVIQEALRNRRPIVCSGIGGMAEKVRDRIDGFHFPAGDSLALASLLLRLSRNPGEFADVGKSMAKPALPDDIGARHARIYESLL
jgi:glycosyltransferase involved in cell wall biosynthesis